MLPVRQFIEHRGRPTCGRLTWSAPTGLVWTVGFEVVWENATPAVTLRYRLRGEEVTQILALSSTLTNFNRRRWWFRCPLVRRGEACFRRIAKLYLPSGTRYWGCRRCHDLVYRSSQEAHKEERVLRWGGFIGKMQARIDQLNGRAS
jgi:hypothetical protein